MHMSLEVYVYKYIYIYVSPTGSGSLETPENWYIVWFQFCKNKAKNIYIYIYISLKKPRFHNWIYSMILILLK